MRVELLRDDEVVAAIGWDGRRALIREVGDDVRATVERIFRVSPVVTDDPSRRGPGRSGPQVVEPGDLDWFFAAARVRGEQEGFVVRFATDTPGGWDPAGSYRRMGDWIGEHEAHADVGHATSGR